MSPEFPSASLPARVPGGDSDTQKFIFSQNKEEEEKEEKEDFQSHEQGLPKSLFSLLSFGLLERAFHNISIEKPFLAFLKKRRKEKKINVPSFKEQAHEYPAHSGFSL